MTDTGKRILDYGEQPISVSKQTQGLTAPRGSVVPDSSKIRAGSAPPRVAEATW